MRIDIQASGFNLTDGLREHTERRLHYALSWASDDLRKVVVRLSDINGPRGGNDKRCRIQIPFSGGADVVIEDTEADLYVAIDRAADRTERAVVRRMERMREYRHERLDTRLVSPVDKDQDAPVTSTTH
ncbi:MAG: HPF/RaiA family ribosome-associated protein [Rhodocyclaceae bacterium]|nr:MAG: HPF/RaiA family ribosome-associated protein [Rhodocyclaceae bacterium]